MLLYVALTLKHVVSFALFGGHVPLVFHYLWGGNDVAEEALFGSDLECFEF